MRNLPRVHALRVDQLNTYDVMCADDVVFTEEALSAFIESRRAATTEQEDAK